MQRCLGCMEEYNEMYDMCPYCGYEKDTPPKEAYHMVPGTVLAGRYLVGRVLGFGGFGVTYIGYDVILSRKVAIKEYLPGEFATRIPGQTRISVYKGEREEQFQNGLKKFTDEAKMLAKMQIANGVVQIFDSFTENETAYIVMEYLEGKTLGQYLEEREKISLEEAKEILHPVILALKDVHQLGVMHRDIAPDNIFLTKDGNVKLLDFGASRFATTSYSKSLSVIIKQGYAPVEQYRSRGEQGPWTDVYSLAATLYRMITGITPSDAMDRAEKEDLIKPSKLGVHISKSEENALMNALNIRAEDRTQNVEILEKELYRDAKVKARFVFLKKADVGAWPLWIKLVMTAAVLVAVIFAGLLGTGIIDYTRLVPESFQVADGMTRVPNLVNEDVVSAEKLLAEADLVMQIIDKQYSEYIPMDMVLTQSISKGQILAKNYVVETVISGGREPVFMTNVSGLYQEEAVNALINAGFKIEIQEEYSTFAQGVIFRQSIAGDTMAYRGDTVVLTVSKGYDGYLDTEQEVTIPNLLEMTMEEAAEEVAKSGLQIVKKGSKPGEGKPGTIVEQNPIAGSVGHQGDTIEIYTIEEKVIIRMPDVQYKDEAGVIEELEVLGLSVTIQYEENATVAKGKVISQSIEAYAEVQEGDKVILVVSLGAPVQQEVVQEEKKETKQPGPWSGWIDALPVGVDASQYDIEEKTQYSYRDKTTMSSGSSALDGWTLYDSTTTKGGYGAWSGWSTTAPTASSDREINSKTQYSYSDYETTQSEQANLSGWNLVSTDTYYLDDYGAWSDWSTSAVSNSNTRKVESKTQYQSRTRQWTTQNDNSTLSGWTLDDSKTTTSYGEWTEWSETQMNPDGGTWQVEYEEKTRQVLWETVYNYYRYKYWGPDYGLSATWWYTWAARGTKETQSTNVELSLWTYHDGYACYGQSGNPWYLESTTPVYITEPYTVYRYRTINKTYYFYQWNNFSDWSDSVIAATADTEVNTRTVYRYADRPAHYKYNYDRWTDYSAFSDTPVSESTTRKVKTTTVYQYRDKQDVTTYHFYRWTDWSEYRDEVLSSSDSREVRQRKLYRYRTK